MKTIHITPLMQILGLAGIVAAVAAAVHAQLPELQRYLNIRKM